MPELTFPLLRLENHHCFFMLVLHLVVVLLVSDVAVWDEPIALVSFLVVCKSEARSIILRD